jgi:hypothetical protein
VGWQWPVNTVHNHKNIELFKVQLYHLNFTEKNTTDLEVHNLPISPVGIEKSRESI